MYLHWAMEPLCGLGEVVLNPTDRNLTTPELIEAAAGSDIIVAHRATPAEAAVFDSLPNRIALLRPELDIRTIDVEAASRNGVLIANAPATFVPSTVEMVLALMIDLARNVSVRAWPTMRDGSRKPGLACSFATVPPELSVMARLANIWRVS